MTHTPATIAFPDARHRVKIGDLEADMFVRVHCGNDACKHVSELHAAYWQERYAADATFTDLAEKFRCSECGTVGTRFWDAWRRE